MQQSTGDSVHPDEAAISSVASPAPPGGPLYWYTRQKLRAVVCCLIELRADDALTRRPEESYALHLPCDV